jgi:tRNA (guanine-N7-)-methyltransferase
MTSPEDSSRPNQDLRSFGRRRGRKLSPRQARLYRELLPQVAIDLAAPPPGDRAALAERLRTERVPGASPAGPCSGREPDVWLEIGFGGGEHLIRQAEQHPEVLLIGAEPFEDGVVKVLSAIEDRGLRNIRLYPDDARPLLRWLPDASIARAFILFPDPWPKARHRKRRLVNPATLKELARVLAVGAELRIGTDIGDYARSILVALREMPEFRWRAQSPRDWRIRPEDWPQTRYEQKAIREGRRCIYLRFERVAAPGCPGLAAGSRGPG